MIPSARRRHSQTASSSDVVPRAEIEGERRNHQSSFGGIAASPIGRFQEVADLGDTAAIPCEPAVANRLAGGLQFDREKILRPLLGPLFREPQIGYAAQAP